MGAAVLTDLQTRVGAQQGHIELRIADKGADLFTGPQGQEDRKGGDIDLSLIHI